mmetsp:Transcript_37427/g.43100  ORF Transcript_37427/g.43100 Transcript_37427/m.43100 type:complete len:110 (+) Transcript_37427:736-1065(+)
MTCSSIRIHTVLYAVYYDSIYRIQARSEMYVRREHGSKKRSKAFFCTLLARLLIMMLEKLDERSSFLFSPFVCFLLLCPVTVTNEQYRIVLCKEAKCEKRSKKKKQGFF